MSQCPCDDDRENEELYAAGAAAQAEIEPPTLLDLADALAAAVDHGDQSNMARVLPSTHVASLQWTAIVVAARAYRAARGGA